MADHFYGITVPGPAGPDEVVKDTSTTSKKVELRVEDAVTGITGNKVAILKAIEAIKAFIAEDDHPA